MKLPFRKGDHVQYEGKQCLITFVCRDYITVCTQQWPDENTLHGHKQVNVVVSRRYWNTITPHASNEEK